MSIAEWKRLAADPTERIDHRRIGASAATPAQRLIEVSREVSTLRRALGDATAAVEAEQRHAQSFHSFSSGASLGGYPMAQHWGDLVVWEAVLNAHPPYRAIFELGTWQGGFSWFLWMQANARSIPFHTFDAIRPDRDVPSFERLDVFLDIDQIAQRMRASEPIVLFCDNGNKPREVREYAPRLSHPDTLIAVHDWGTEMLPTDVPEGVEEVYGDYCDEMRSITRFFRLAR